MNMLNCYTNLIPLAAEQKIGLPLNPVHTNNYITQDFETILLMACFTMAILNDRYYYYSLTTDTIIIVSFLEDHDDIFQS